MNHPFTRGRGLRRPSTRQGSYRGITAAASLSLVLATGLVVPMTATAAPVPGATADEDLANAPGATVSLDVLANDDGDFEASTVVLVAGAERGRRIVVPGEGVWSAGAGGIVVFTPEDLPDSAPTPITYEVSTPAGDTSSASITVTYGTQETDVTVVGYDFYQPVLIPVLGDDTASWDFSTFRLIDPSSKERVTSVTVPGEGTWTLDAAAGTVSFTLAPGTYADPTQIMYEVRDNDGDVTMARIDLFFLGDTLNDEVTDNIPGTAVTVDVLANDLGSFHPSGVQILVPGTEATYVSSVEVPGEGTWVVNTNGTITFTPAAGSTGNPTPILYSVVGALGETTNDASVVITYRGAAPVVTPPVAVPVPYRAAPLPVTG